MAPPEWCPDADAMVLDKSIEGEIYFTRDGWELLDVHSIRIKIFSEAGKAQGTFPIIAQEGHKVKNIKARTISPDGKVTKVKKSQIIKKKTYGGIENDQRYIVYQIAFPAVEVGAILELNFDSYTDNVYLMSPYYLDVRNIPTETSTITFSIPSNIVYLKSGMNTELYDFTESIDDVRTLGQGDRVQYSATIEHVPALLNEPFAPGDELVRPHIYFVFSSVRIGLASFDIIPNWQVAVSLLEKIFDSYLTDKKVDLTLGDRIQEQYPDSPAETALYRWVTDSIQWVDSRFWLDFSKSPSEVIEAKVGTGIEKALTLIKLYRDAGLPARLLLVNPINQSRTMTKLPNLLQFNTYLIQTRVDGEFQYIDPTKPHTGFGHYPWYFEGASALVVDSSYADIITVPVTDRINQENWDLKARLDSSGNLYAEGSVSFYHQFCHDVRDQIANADSTELVEFLETMANAEDNIEFPFCKHADELDTDTSITVSLALQIDNYAEILGDDILFMPDFIERLSIDIQERNKPREVDVFFSYAKRSVISMEIEYPHNFKVMEETKRIRLHDVPQMRYQIDIVPNHEEHKLLYRRVYQRENYCFPADYYHDICGFLRNVSNNDRVEVALARTQGE